MITDYVDVENGRIYYEEAGDGTPIIFIHGYALDNRIWDYQFSFFACGYRVIRYDLRGFGKSSLPSEQIYSHHDDLKSLLNFRKIKEATIIGLSMGGAIAINFCLTYPDLVNKLVLVDSDISGLKKYSNSRSYISIEIGRQNWFSDPLISRAMGKKMIAPKLRKIINEYSGWHWVHNDNSRVDLNPRALDKLPDIKIPTLIIVGEKDEEYFQNAAKILNENIPDSKCVIIKNVGHLISLEAPLKLCRVVKNFLEG